jgi:HPt (histidine-containing phosphotransfer) domain-containing protein
MDALGESARVLVADDSEVSKQVSQVSETGAGQQTERNLNAHFIAERLRELAEALDCYQMSKILDKASSESKRRWQALIAAKEAKDLAQLSREAHSMKGSYRNLGAVMLAQSFEQLEHHAMDMDVDTLERLLADTERAMEEVQAVFEEEKERLPSLY